MYERAMLRTTPLARLVVKTFWNFRQEKKTDRFKRDIADRSPRYTQTSDLKSEKSRPTIFDIYKSIEFRTGVLYQFIRPENSSFY